MTLLLAPKSPLLDLYRGQREIQCNHWKLSLQRYQYFHSTDRLSLQLGLPSHQTTEENNPLGLCCNFGPGVTQWRLNEPCIFWRRPQIADPTKTNIMATENKSAVFNLFRESNSLIGFSWNVLPFFPFLLYLWVISPVTLFIGSEVIRNHALRVCTQTGHPKRPLCIKFLIVWHKFSLSLSLRQESSHLFTNRLRPSPCF